jgi:uncharacterized protein YoxC
MTWALQSATLALVGVAIAAVIYLLIVLVKLRRVLVRVEATLETARKDVDATLAEANRALQRLEAVAASTEQVMREEVAPTLRVARETLTDIEVTTRAVADTTLVARRIAERADTLVDTQRLLAIGGTVTQFVLRKSASAAGGLLSGVGGGLRSLLSRRSAPKTTVRPVKSPASRPELPDSPPTNELITEPESAPQPVGAGRRKR